MNAGIARPDVLQYFGQMLDGVEAAHLSSVSHRDLKPENIFVESTESNTEVAIGDFGIAHFTLGGATQIVTGRGKRMGNYQYASPEQRTKGGKATHLSDVYTLGVILNEMFTGQILQGAGYRTVGSIDAEFAHLVPSLKMVQQDSSSRFQSIKEVKLILRLRDAENISLQKVSKLSEEVIDEYAVDDPFVKRPVSIVGFDYNPETRSLIVALNRNPTSSWIEIFRGINPGNDYLTGSRPKDIRFHNDKMYMSVNPENANLVAQFANKDPSLAGSAYVRHTERQNASKKAEDNARRKRDYDNEQIRLFALQSIRAANETRFDSGSPPEKTLGFILFGTIWFEVEASGIFYTEAYYYTPQGEKISRNEEIEPKWPE